MFILHLICIHTLLRREGSLSRGFCLWQGTHSGFHGSRLHSLVCGCLQTDLFLFQFLRLHAMGWRDGSAVMLTVCSIPSTHVASCNLSVTLVPGLLTPSHRHKCWQNTNAHKIRKRKLPLLVPQTEFVPTLGLTSCDCFLPSKTHLF